MKYFTTILAFLLILAVLSPAAVCAHEQDRATCIVYDDGSYIIIEITQIQSRAGSTRIAAKDYTYYDATDVKQWKATVTGTFTYDGTTSACTAVSTSYTRYTTTWTLDSVSKSKSGATAIGDFYLSCSLWETSVRVELTCDKNGNLS